MQLHYLSIAAVITSALVGCGGGSSNDNSTAPSPVAGPSTGAGAAPSTPVSTIGKIDAFGSVVVGGIHYESDNAEIFVNGELAAEQALDIGQIVEIEGLIDRETGEGIATRIEYFTDVQGEITAFNPETGELTVLGQTIIIQDDLLELSGIDLEELVAGLNIEVSGHRDENDNLVATFIEVSTSGEEIIRGEITNIDLANLTIEVNGQPVSIENLTEIPFEELVEGLELFIVGNLEGDTLLPELNLDLDDFFADAEVTSAVEVEGVISEIIDDNSFVIGGITFNITSETVFEDGSASDIEVGRLVEVEGEFTDASVVAVSSVEFDLESDIELFGFVESIDAENNQFVMFGLPFNTSEDTVWDDESDADIRDFSIADLNIGDFLEVEAITMFQDPISFEVKRVERQNSNIDTTFSGEIVVVSQVEAFENNVLTLASGIDLLITDATDLSAFGDAPDLTSVVGTIVEVEAIDEQGVLVAQSIAPVEACGTSTTLMLESSASNADSANSGETTSSMASNNLSVQGFCSVDISFTETIEVVETPLP